MSTDSASVVDDIQRGTGTGALAFGAAAILAPGALTRAYGLTDTSPDFRYVMRMWGTRTAFLGAITMMAPPGAPRRALFLAATCMNAVDATAALTTPGLPRRTRIMAALTSAGFGAAGVYALAIDS